MPDTMLKFTSKILRAVSSLNKLKVRLELWDNEDLYDPESHVTFTDPQDFDIRARQVEFVDKREYPIRTTLPLSRFMMSDIPPSMTLHRLLNDLDLFLDDLLSEQSRRVVKARLAPLEMACDQYDVDAFRSTLRSFLTYLSYFRGLVPPQHLIEFAQDSASIETGMGKISDCPKDISVPP